MDLINLIFLIVAGVIFWRLRSVLGRRTGHERPRGDPYAARDPAEAGASGARDDNVVHLPNSSAENRAPAASRPIPEGSPLKRTLTELTLADRRFDPDHFLSGAQKAYEMIVTAYAEGDLETLKPLLNDEVFRSFESAIREREARRHSVEFQFAGIKSADIVDASLKSSRAEITVKFVSGIVSITKDADGVVIEGEPGRLRQVVDVWTFARETASPDPNWKLVATGTSE